MNFKCSVALSQLLPDLVVERRMRWKTSDPHRCGHVPDRRFKTKRWWWWWWWWWWLLK